MALRAAALGSVEAQAKNLTCKQMVGKQGSVYIAPSDQNACTAYIKQSFHIIYISLNVWDYIYNDQMVYDSMIHIDTEITSIYRYRYICIQCPDQGIGEELEEEET